MTLRARLALSVAAAASLGAGVLVAGVGVTADASIRQPSVVSTDPADFTPRPLGPQIRGVAQRGGIALAFVVIAGKIDRAAYQRIYATVIVSVAKRLIKQRAKRLSMRWKRKASTV